MSTKRTTRWMDNEDGNFENIIQNFMDYDSIKIDNKSDNKTVYNNFKTYKLFEENEEIILNNETIIFNGVIFTYNLIRKGNEPIEERIMPQESKIIVFKYKNSIKYIIDKNSEAKFFIRKLLKYEGQKEIEQVSSPMDNDLFLWMLYKIYNEDTAFSLAIGNNENKELYLNNIKFFRGKSLDNNKVTSQGNTVLNLISTLSFVLERGNLDQIVLCVEYDVHENIEIRLDTGGLVGVDDIKKYDGAFENEEENLIFSKLILIIYIEILPNLIQDYNFEVENEEWGSNVKVGFLESIKNDITSRIETMKNEL